MDEAIRRKVCRLVAGLVVADDDLDASEDEVIDKMLAMFGLRPEEREWLFPIIDPAEAAQEIAAMPAHLQAQTFDLLVQAAAVDKRFAREEREYLLSAARAIGVAEDEVERRVAAAIAGPQTGT